jgi:MoxR-like ATPase
VLTSTVLGEAARTILQPSAADALVSAVIELETLSVSEFKVIAEDEVPGFGPYKLLLNPAFIRAAARAGAVFYYGSDGLIHRYALDREVRSSIPPLPVASDKKVDPDYYLEPPWLDDLRRLLKSDKTVLLIGPAGSGKTEGCERLFAERGQRLLIVSCTPRTTADDLEGAVDLISEDGLQVTRFTPAAPAVASANGYGLLLDEGDAAPAEAMYSMYRLLDQKQMHILRMGHDAEIPRHPGLRIVGTQNTEGRGDDTGLHHGRSYQDEAYLDRWSDAIRVNYPDPGAEKKILRRRTGITPTKADRIIEAAGSLRTALEKGDDILFCCSLRRTLAVAANIQAGFTADKAWHLAVLNRITPEDATRVLEVLKRLYGTNLNK